MVHHTVEDSCPVAKMSQISHAGRLLASLEGERFGNVIRCLVCKIIVEAEHLDRSVDTSVCLRFQGSHHETLQNKVAGLPTQCLRHCSSTLYTVYKHRVWPFCQKLGQRVAGDVAAEMP